MTLHYSNNQLLLQNTSNLSWYYIAITTLAGALRISVLPTALIYSGTPYAPYAVLVDDQGTYWKFQLATDEIGNVTYSIAPLAIPGPPDRLVLMDDTGVYQRLILTINPADSRVYPQIVPATETISSIMTPWPTLRKVEAQETAPIRQVDYLGKTTVAIPDSVLT